MGGRKRRRVGAAPQRKEITRASKRLVRSFLAVASEPSKGVKAIMAPSPKGPLIQSGGWARMRSRWDWMRWRICMMRPSAPKKDPATEVAGGGGGGGGGWGGWGGVG